MKIVVSIIFILFSICGFSQNPTIGLLQNSNSSFNGYTFFAPPGPKSYLIDNCGNKVNEWESDFNPGLSAYILENGNMIRTKRVPNPTFLEGGSGGGFEIFDWENNLIWDYTYSSEDHQQHHDISYLPNGNVLILAWLAIDAQSAIEAGKNPAGLEDFIWVTQVVEVQQTGLNSGEIVWEWNLFRHIVQDFDQSKDNYGVVADHPELVNFNYGTNFGITGSDWIHANSIDYNEELDLIVISSRNFNEFWIIDHSTTMQESASHSGGNFGKGGDILYRWGNPVAYDRGLFSDKKLFRQHDASWIDEGLPNEGAIMIFNNGDGRPDGNYSSVDIINLPVDPDGNFILEMEEPFGPEQALYSYVADPPESFYSHRMSGAQQLPNGNILICRSRNAYFFEIDPSENVVWEYICPIKDGLALAQGSDPSFPDDVFRSYRYAEDYPGFDGLDLTPGDPIEINPLNQDCIIFPDSTTSILAHDFVLNLEFVQNSLQNQLEINLMQDGPIEFIIYNLQGQRVLKRTVHSGTNYIEINGLESSLYLAQFCELKTNYCKSLKFFKE